MALINVIVKEPGKPAQFRKIPDRLEGFWDTIGGYFEAYRVLDDVYLLVDELGKTKGLPFNCNLCGVDWCGPMILVKSSADDFVNIQPGEEASFRRVFARLFKGEEVNT